MRYFFEHSELFDTFQTDFHKIYGIRKTSSLEMLLSMGIAVLKTPDCQKSLDLCDDYHLDSSTGQQSGTQS